MNRRFAFDLAALLGCCLLFLAIQEFLWHALLRGVHAFQGDGTARGRLSGSPLSDAAIFSHMVLGGLVTGLSVLQITGPVRRKYPRIHRLSGRVLSPLALLTALGGLVYILLRGTIGGWPMTLGFGLYGVLMAVAAIRAPWLAMQGDLVRHRRWGLRLAILCLGSWIYRVHYGLFYGLVCDGSATGCGSWSRPDFSGSFDLIQNFAFYLPYLLLLELTFRRRQHP